MESLEEYLKKRHTAGTAKRYLRDINLFFSSIESPSTATYQDIIQYLGGLRKQYQNPETIRTSLHGIKKYYQWLCDTDQRKDHPCKYLKLRDKKNKDIQLQDLFTTEELELLLEREERYTDLKLRNQLIISLLIYQGLTTGELTKLELRDINLQEAEIYIKPGTKTNSRTLQLKPRQIMLFYEYLYQLRPKLLRKPTEKLIITKLGTAETGEQISYLVSTFKALFPERNINPKTIRQSVITNLLKSGNDLRVVQTFAGHKYPSATERYKQSNVEELKHAVLKYHPLQ